uniref:Uncharacterized protein n=1 Tax=Arundo donax TaxID=35708 RepID=A0A0A9T5Q0_ARUDO
MNKFIFFMFLCILEVIIVTLRWLLWQPKSLTS